MKTAAPCRADPPPDAKKRVSCVSRFFRPTHHPLQRPVQLVGFGTGSAKTRLPRRSGLALASSILQNPSERVGSF